MQMLTESHCSSGTPELMRRDHIGLALSSAWFPVWRRVRLKTRQELSTHAAFESITCWVVGLSYRNNDLHHLNSLIALMSHY